METFNIISIGLMISKISLNGNGVENVINARWIKAGSLIVDLPSMEKGFREEERLHQEIWDYIQYRESLLTWPSKNEEVRKGIFREEGERESHPRDRGAGFTL